MAGPLAAGDVDTSLLRDDQDAAKTKLEKLKRKTE
jgi:hypothetical protein